MGISRRVRPARGGPGEAGRERIQARRAGVVARPGLLAPLLALLLGAGALSAQAVGRPVSGAGGAAAGARIAAGVVGSAGGTDCLRCHALPNLGYRDSALSRLKSFTVGPERYLASAHGKLACRQCHADIDSFPHPASAQRRRVTCDADCHAVDSAGRPYTHANEMAEYRESVHGDSVHTGAGGVVLRGPDADAPTCLTCHGAGDAHAIVPAARLTPRARMALCVSCHDDRPLMARHGVPVDAVASYRRSFHYKAIRFGRENTAVCSDCHTAHHVLPPGDPRSTVAAANLTRTCGQTGCHAGAQHNFAVSGANHLDLRVAQVPLLWFEEKFFLLLTGGTMLMLLVGIVLDVQRRFGWLALAARAGRALARGSGRLRPVLAHSGRRGLRLARQLLVD